VQHKVETTAFLRNYLINILKNKGENPTPKKGAIGKTMIGD